MLKWIGAVLIVVSSAGIGISFSADLKKRCMELRLLKQMIYMLRGEVKYTRTPLPEAFLQIAVRLPNPFADFLQACAEKMRELDGQTFSELWQEQIRNRLSNTHLTKEDKAQLEVLGDTLGYLDVEMQLSAMELYLEQLELGIQKAQEALAAKQKLYQSLGVAGGIFLVILLV